MRLKLFIIALCATAMPAAAQTCTYDVNINSAQYFSVAVPDGNYKVTVTLGSRKRKAETVVRAESRRLMLENVATKKGQFAEYSFIVNKRSPKFIVNTATTIFLCGNSTVVDQTVSHGRVGDR